MMSSHSAGKPLCLAAFTFALSLGSAFAQQPPQQPAPAGGQQNMPGMNMRTPDLGLVSGTVTKAAGGGAAPGATVQATNLANGIQYSATADDNGRYTLPSLAVGTYDIAVQLGGFQTFRRPGVIVTTNSSQTIDVALVAGNADTERLALLDRIEQLEKRLADLESSAVLSEPETRVKRVEVYVDKNGNEFENPTEGAKKTVTYQRERVYRRQTINEKIEEAMASAKDQAVAIGVDATTVAQGARRTEGVDDPERSIYALASADLFFTAKLAQYTTFFADVVALSGAPPDREIPSLTLLNGYTARLVNQNELNLREAWLRTQFFGQRLSLTAGRLDLTNYFDRNAGANDETTQFISDALVNNQMLGLAVNGTGAVAEYDSKHAFTARFGVQQSNPDATSLSDSIYSLTEVGYTFTPFSLPEGHYRAWFRANNVSDSDPDAAFASKRAFGLSVDQKVTPVLTLFGRYGTQKLPSDRDHYFSAGVSFANGLVFNPLDTWGIGYARMDLASGDTEHLTEGYYNFRLTERLRLSLMLQHVLDTQSSKFGYFLPGVRLQAAF
jgi:hypothetical protein